MNNFVRTLIAGYGAKKLGGGCISTILIFIVIYWVLGQTCNGNNNNNNVQRRTGQELNIKVPANAEITQTIKGI